MRKKFHRVVILMTAVFSFQTFDMPPARNTANPKTCCGQTVCMCSHAAKGSHCSFRRHAHVGEAKRSLPLKEMNFTKAPCASHVPKTILPEYSKDFFLPEPGRYSGLMQSGFVFIPAPAVLPLPREQGIERPPRSLLFF